MVSLIVPDFSIRALHSQNKFNFLEEILKQVEFADKETELAKRQEPCVEVRYMRVSDKMKRLRLSSPWPFPVA